MTPNSSPARSEKPPAKLPELRLGGGAAALLGRALYNLAWYPAFPLAMLLSGARLADVRRQRMGHVDRLPEAGGARRIWLHAASVGEIEAVRQIASGLLQRESGAVMVVTTMTQAGCDAAQRRIPGAASCRLAPLDHPLSVRNFLNAVKPDVVLVAEAELWPNYFIESRRLGARVVLVNGRLSDRSVGRYRLLRPLWASALSCADLLLVQSQSDAERYLELGAPAARIVVTGNTKFELADNGHSNAHPALAEFAAAGRTLIAGSTAPGEEEQVLDAFLQLRRQFSDLRLVLAPRHLERLGEIIDLLKAGGLEYVNASALKTGAQACSAARVLLLDTLGDLRLLYSCGTLAFVGGSLFAGRGGQNLGEPAAAGVAVLFGPFHHKQQEMAQALLAHDGGAVVKDAHAIVCAAAPLLDDETRRRERGDRARQAYNSLAGGSARSLAALCELIDSR